MDEKKLAKDIVLSSMGQENDYLERLIVKIMDENKPSKPVISKYTLLEVKLRAEINNLRKNIKSGFSDIESESSTADNSKFLITSLLDAKLRERSELERSNIHKTILGVLVVVIPLITNGIQAIVNSFICKKN